MTMEFLDDEETLPVKVEPDEVAQPRRKLSREERIEERLQEAENEVFAGALNTLADALHWRDINPDDDEPPLEWVQHLGLKEAQKRHRVARAAWMANKDAPAGLKIANQVMAAVVKGREARAVSEKPMNVQVSVAVDPDVYEYAVKEVKE